jgi:hypothetical protein
MGEYWVVESADGRLWGRRHGVTGYEWVQRCDAARYDSRGEAQSARWHAGGSVVVHVTTRKREKAERDDVRKLYRTSENQRAAITAERDTLVRELVAKQAEIDRAWKESTSWQQHAVDRAAERDEARRQLAEAVRQRDEAKENAASHGRTARDLTYGFEQRVKAANDAAVSLERRYLAKRYENVYGGYVVGFIAADLTQRIFERKGAGEG